MAKSMRAKLERFFKNKVAVGDIVTNDQIRKVAAPGSTYTRRIREMREDGWKIDTHRDDASLKPGEYRLAAPPPSTRAYTFSRGISNRLRSAVLERNGFTCQTCGLGAEETDPDTGRQVKLQVGHIVDRAHGGKDEMSNLRAMCSRCNEGARHLTQEPPSWVWLLSQIRRASIGDQQQAYNWLKAKFEGKKS